MKAEDLDYFQVLEFESDSLGKRLHLENHVTVLAPSTGLADILSLGPGGIANRLAVRNLGAADLDVNAELPLEAVHDDFKVKLSHA